MKPGVSNWHSIYFLSNNQLVIKNLIFVIFRHSDVILDKCRYCFIFCENYLDSEISKKKKTKKQITNVVRKLLKQSH